jgi:hypothetical protein
MDTGVKESELGPLKPPNPGPRNEGPFYSKYNVEPMEVDTTIEYMETDSGYGSDMEIDEGEEDLPSQFRKLRVCE